VNDERGTAVADDEAIKALMERWTALAGPGGAEQGRGLIARYREPQRRYHTAEHLAHVLDVVDLLAAEAAQPDTVRFAAWFHDAVYEIGHADGPSNEELSARLAENVLPGLGVATDVVAEVAGLVRGTAHHVFDPDDRNGAVLCDADLAILGGDALAYRRYAAQVRDEYRAVPDEQFRSGRAAILRDFLAREAIYQTAAARERYEQAARVNLTAEIARLSA
jgi:predicted metal-dependent HD superfamily phosphohydrolase